MPTYRNEMTNKRIGQGSHRCSKRVSMLIIAIQGLRLTVTFEKETKTFTKTNTLIFQSLRRKGKIHTHTCTHAPIKSRHYRSNGAVVVGCNFAVRSFAWTSLGPLALHVNIDRDELPHSPPPRHLARRILP